MIHFTGRADLIATYRLMYEACISSDSRQIELERRIRRMEATLDEKVRGEQDNPVVFR